MIQPLKNLSYLDLSHINLLTEYNGFNLSLSSISLSTILHSLNISYNYLKTLEGPISNLSIDVPRYLDFRSNQFQSQLPVLPHVNYLDFSMNNFNSALPTSIGQSLESANFFSISSNKLYGSIPKSICKATNLRFFNLSDNYLSGTIPQCLIENGYLSVLKLRRNKLNGTIPNTFSDCNLQTLAINQNQLEGELPKSLKNWHGLMSWTLGTTSSRIPSHFTWIQSHWRFLFCGLTNFMGPLLIQSFTPHGRYFKS